MTQSLNVELDAHLWLLHYLFLPILNREIKAWAEAWNNHRMQIPGHGHRSPADLRFFDRLHNGYRGRKPGSENDLEDDEDMTEEEAQEYGIDWEQYDNAAAQNHEQEQEQQDPFPQNPFLTHEPEHHPHVMVDESRRPFTDEQLAIFQHNLRLFPQHILQAATPDDKKGLWVMALTLAKLVWEHSNE